MFVQFFNLYWKVRAAFSPNKAINVTTQLLDTFNFCKRHGYPLKEITEVMPAAQKCLEIIKSIDGWDTLEERKQCLNKNCDSCAFVDLSPEAYSPLLDGVRASLVQVPPTNKSPITRIISMPPDASARWIAHQIKKINAPRVAIITENSVVVQKIKSELGQLNMPFSGHISLYQTTLGGTVVSMAERINIAKHASLEEIVTRHQETLIGFAQESDYLDESDAEIVHGFFDEVRHSFLNLADGNFGHTSEEYRRLISELLRMYPIAYTSVSNTTKLTKIKTSLDLLESEFLENRPSVNLEKRIMFLSLKNAFSDDYDVVLIPEMNGDKWMTREQIPSLASVADNFNEHYFAPLEEAVLSHITTSTDTYITVNDSEPIHRLLLDKQITQHGSDTGPESAFQLVPHAPSEAFVPVWAKPRSFSVADVQLLANDPYAFYVKRILGLHPHRQPRFEGFARDVLKSYFSRDLSDKTMSLPDFACQWIANNVEEASTFDELPPNFVLKLLMVFEHFNESLVERREYEILSGYKMQMVVNINCDSYTIFGTADRVDINPQNNVSSAMDASEEETSEACIGRSGSEAYIIEYAARSTSLTLPLKALMFSKCATGTLLTLEYYPLGSVRATTEQNSSELMRTVEKKVNEILLMYASESFAFKRQSSAHAHLFRSSR
jgi:hypothetical protein